VSLICFTGFLNALGSYIDFCVFLGVDEFLLLLLLLVKLFYFIFVVEEIVTNSAKLFNLLLELDVDYLFVSLNSFVASVVRGLVPSLNNLISEIVEKIIKSCVHEEVLDGLFGVLVADSFHDTENSTFIIVGVIVGA
jgi:hypothetical protein